jgi:two-component system cell cycle response regulator DivK
MSSNQVADVPSEAAALLKRDEATRAIPVITLSALAMKGDEARIRAAGCDGYAAKPLAYKDFLAVISAHLMVLPL